MRPPRPNAYRDAWCGTLTAERVGESVRVAGWVHRRRDHGGLVFIDLRDRSGIVQLVFHPDRAPDAHRVAHDLRAEDVLSARGEVLRRDPENVNPSIPTGEIEIAVAEVEQLADAQTPPFPIDEEVPVDELLRLRHRPLDLRRDSMQRALTLRHDVARTIRTHLYERDFLEIETPMLTRSTPEGARDYLVPARLAPGSFYALPQSPQLFKELLMIAGYERYFQIVRCFRDEDPRADRQPEFTQLDLEMAFVGEEDVLELIEGLMSEVFREAGFAVSDPPWLRVPYDEAVLRYGTDRPDLRFELEIRDVSDIVRGSEFKVFESVLARDDGVVRAINVGPLELSRAEQEQLNELVRPQGAKAVAPIYVGDGGWRSNLAKFFSPDQIAAVNSALGARDGDLLLFVADRRSVAARALGELRQRMAERLGLIAEGRHEVCWIVDFPMFEWNEGEGRWDPLHHPFTAPAMADGGPLSFEDPGALRSRAYDMVVDGWELGGGSIRINTPEVQREVLKLVGISEEEADQRFGFLLDALRYGAPPLGAIAFGLDRIVAILAGRDSIRDVIAFPKTSTGADPLTGAPAPVDAAQLRELGLRLLDTPPKR
ncbi:MAG TPA: aspartate--tRNA ligase [Solirubrobacteraceae bacterium]|nr:aspartate--tRNA ligase [Solirubrobacteraceae bacterium]